jgi:hypothetical protein
VARTGKYKALIVTGLAVMAFGLFLMSGLRADTELPTLWVWMFITGLGIGPTLSVFTIVVQNAVPFAKLGVATSNLTFFRQIGGSIGLALLGTAFGQRLTAELPGQLTAAGVPAQLVGQFGANAGASEKFIEVGKDLGTTILAGVPAQFRSVVEPLIPNIIHGFYSAYSIAVSSIFGIGVITTVLALLAALVMRELPLRTTMGPGPGPGPGAAPH